MTMLDRVIGVEEAAQITGYAEGYLKNLCYKKKIPSKKIGNVWVIDRFTEEFLELFEKRKLRNEGMLMKNSRKWVTVHRHKDFEIEVLNGATDVNEIGYRIKGYETLPLFNTVAGAINYIDSGEVYII